MLDKHQAVTHGRSEHVISFQAVAPLVFLLFIDLVRQCLVSHGAASVGSCEITYCVRSLLVVIICSDLIFCERENKRSSILLMEKS